MKSTEKNNSIKGVIVNKQYNQGYNIGTRLAETRILRFGPVDGVKEIHKLICVDGKIIDSDIEMGIKPSTFVKGRMNALLDYINNYLGDC